MKLYQVTLKDILRRKRRTLYTALGVAIGVAAVIAVLTVVKAGEERIYSALEKYGPNLLVMPAVNDMALQLGDLRLGSLAVGDNYIAEEKLYEIREIADGAIREALDIDGQDNIATIAPKLYMNTMVDGSSVMIVGFEPEQEMLIKSWWRMSQGEYPEGQNEVIVGARTGAILDVAPGDSILLEGQQVTVTGILDETGSNDDYQIYLPLRTAQTIFNKEGLISAADIRALCSACPVTDIADVINDSLPGVRAVAVKQVADTEMNLMRKINRFMLALAGITLAVGSFGVVNTMISSVYERIRDIAVMKSVGASRRQILKMFLYEAASVGLVGGIVGYIAGTLLAYLIGPLIFDDLTVSYVPGYILPALGLAIVIAAAASIYPAYRASKLSVADSLRSL